MPGVRANTLRGKGIFFGRDISQDFLRREDLKYLVRGHEEIEEGVLDLSCGDGRSVITVFSTVDPESGDNLGGVVNLSNDGTYTAVRFGPDGKVTTELKGGKEDSAFGFNTIMELFGQIKS